MRISGKPAIPQVDKPQFGFPGMESFIKYETLPVKGVTDTTTPFLRVLELNEGVHQVSPLSDSNRLEALPLEKCDNDFLLKSSETITPILPV